MCAYIDLPHITRRITNENQTSSCAKFDQPVEYLRSVVALLSLPSLSNSQHRKPAFLTLHSAKMEQLRQAQENGIVIGLKGVSSGPVLRRDIDDLIVNYPDTFNLFLLALSELQRDEQVNNKMGYQQIAGN